MTYVIAGTCIKDDSCLEVCPVDCDACVEACPVDAIYPDFELPEKFAYALELNEEFFAEAGTAERTAA